MSFDRNCRGLISVDSQDALRTASYFINFCDFISHRRIINKNFQDKLQLS